jgi:hypothetical protein
VVVKQADFGDPASLWQAFAGAEKVWSDVLRRAGQDRELPDRGERARDHPDWASAAVDWRLFLQESLDDEKTADDRTATEIRARRACSAISDEVRHREEGRLALDVLDEVIGEWWLRSRFFALRVRPSNRNILRAADGSLLEC